MRSSAKPVAALALILIAVTAACTKAEQELSAEARYAWLHMQGNLLAQERLLEPQLLTPTDTLFTNVHIVDVVNGTIRQHASVLVRDGKIAWVRDMGDVPAIVDARQVDGDGRYLAPGLTDMHVHTHDDADYLLHLAHGVTTIREMNGWPWRLARRELLESGKLLAPTMFITSRILNSSDFGGYAIPINTAEEARAEVRKAAKKGYDAIKTHNGLTHDAFMAIIDESQALGLDVVGHIPVRVSVADAIAAGMHTAEHFKGYIDDSTLEISTEDWLTPSIDMDTYLTPTFYTYREHQRGADASRILENDGRLVLPHRRLAWQRYVEEDADRLTLLRQTIRPKSEKIFRTLLPHDIKWLAGTDSGGYELMVPGDALIEELETMERLGLSPLETLRSATTRAAQAMGRDDRSGHIAPGMNADLILLDANPLQTVANLRRLQAVMVRGTWLPDPKALIENGDGIDQSFDAVDQREFAAAVAMAEDHAAAGYAQSTMSLELWIGLAGELDEPDLVNRLAALYGDIPDTDPGHAF